MMVLRKGIRCIKKLLYCLLCFLVLHTFLWLMSEHSSRTLGGLRSNIQVVDEDNSLVPQTRFANKFKAYRLKELPNDVTFDKEDMLDANGKPYKIILWTNRNLGEYTANPEVCFANVSCVITYDKELLNTSHAIVFRAGKFSGRHMPLERKSYQLFVWWTVETPLHTPATNGMNNFFNLTFHYRTDADVYAPYGSTQLILRELEARGETDLEELLARKWRANKTVIWAVSNCYEKRMIYAKSLMAAGLEVDVYGSCFGRRKELGEGRYSPQMYETISQYKFYFSFENSINCKDYITEKFWFNGLRSGAVPVVWGPRKLDVLKVAPTKSFIHTDDFSSPVELVRYLQYLANNQTAYAEYLQWRTWVKHPENIEKHLQELATERNDLRSFCPLCSIIQANERRRKYNLKSPHKIIKSLKEAWNGPENGECHQ
ncbi:4-galactosyl-N-acetylglucosaminide 3-alpha-L-fucosyltransferase FUT6-like [Clavelina lepadiformis]|uniref:4-galactosyl-N-acetylglucosaminide 3-alpha-L-fucosyltransferase FUT6-like n=1 Tax=Clavelina lepadiformis TaxID=159417 RepID=UPI0040428E36